MQDYNKRIEKDWDWYREMEAGFQKDKDSPTWDKSSNELIWKKLHRNLFLKSTLYTLCRDCLGYRDLNEIHKELCWFLEEDHPFKLILMPRYTFKSSVATVAFSLFNLLRDKNHRVLIYSDAQSKAEAFLSSIKSHIEGNVEGSGFARWFDWFNRDKNATWNLSQIAIKGRTTSYPEPSVDTAGEGAGKVGMHYDTIIFDDLVSDKNVTTKDYMDKIANCYKKALSLLKPGGKVLLIGTRWHFGDLYGRLIAENPTTNMFKIFIKSAIAPDGTYLFDKIGPNSLTKEFLAQQKANQGTYTFSCLYMNSPTDPETAVFKNRDFSFYGAIKKDDLYITATCDPAGQGEDFTAITVLGTDNKMNMHILEIVNKNKMQPSEIIETVIRLHYKYTFRMFGLEKNFYRGMLKKALQERITLEQSENLNFKLFGMREFEPTSRRGQSKTNRIMALQPYHEKGSIKFPGDKYELLENEFSILANQMTCMTSDGCKAPHDDILDSLAYHLPLIQKGGLVKKAELPYNSPAELERRVYDQEINRMNRLPRRLRQRVIGQLAFS